MFTGVILPDRPLRRTSNQRYLSGPVAGLALLLLLSGCATTSGDRGKEPQSAPDIYAAGASALESGNYSAAIRQFQRLDILHPGDRHAIQGQIESVFAWYQEGDYASAIAAAGRFIRQHPDHPNLDYMFYLRGLARFDQALLDLDAIAGTTGPRPPTVDLALQNFSELIGRYPQSRYSADARNRATHLRQRVARHELESARQHINRGEYTSGGLRARSVIEFYPDSGLATEAATIVNMANRMLNLEGAIRDDAPAAVAPPATPVPAPADVPAAQPTPAPARDDGVRREDWIERQSGRAWTIQLFGTANEQSLLSFIEQHRLTDVAYFKSTRGDRPWFSLIHGVYDDIDGARAAAERMPRAVLGDSPWIRRMSDIQAIVKLERLEREVGQ